MNALEQYAANAAHAITTTPLPTMSQFLHMEDCVKAREDQLSAIIQKHAINPAVKELVDALKEANTCLARFAFNGGRLAESDWCKTQQLISSALVKYKDLP